MSMRPAGAPAVRARAVDRDHAGRGVLADRRALQPRAVQRADRHRYPGIVISDRWNGYSHLDPNQRQVCWSHIQRDFRRHADGLGEQKTFGETGLPAHQAGVRRLARLPARAPRPRPPPGRDRTDPDRTPATARRRQPKKATQSLAPPVRQQPAQGLARALDVHPIDGVEPTNNPAERALRGPVIHRKSRTAPEATTASDSPNARYPPPPPAACNTARCSPTSANCSPPTTAATHSPRSPKQAPGTERLRSGPRLQKLRGSCWLHGRQSGRDWRMLRSSRVRLRLDPVGVGYSCRGVR